MKYAVTVGGEDFTVEFRAGEVLVDGTPVHAELEADGGPAEYRLFLEGACESVSLDRANGQWRVQVGGEHRDVTVVDERVKKLRELTGDSGGAAGHEVLILGPTPGNGNDLPTFFARGGPTTAARDGNVLIPPGLEEMLEQVAHATGATLVKPSDSQCDEDMCSLLVDGAPVLFDDHHPSLSMANRMAPLLVEAMTEPE